MKDLAIYGAGGFGMEIACIIKMINKNNSTWRFLGFFDDGLNVGSSNSFGSILGGLAELNNWNKELAIVMAIANPNISNPLIEKINNNNLIFPNIISPDVTFLEPSSFSLGKGNIIMPQCLVSFGVNIGDFNFFNCGTSIGHEVKMGSFNSIMSYVKISGCVEIGDANYFGVCAVVLQGINIGQHTTIGTNSVIMRKTKDFTTYLGNPAIPLLKPNIK